MLDTRLYFRQISLTGMPASASFKIDTFCVSLYFAFLMVVLLATLWQDSLTMSDS